MFIPDAQLSAATYAFLADLVYERSRIRLGPDKHALVAGRLAGQLEKRGCASYEQYCELLRSPAGEEEIGSLVDLISTNHTHFFREPDHFHVLARDLLPALSRRVVADDRPAQVWCAAAASGEEAYSIAIVLAEHARRQPGFDWSVQASDISRRMLDRARLGVYEAERIALPDRSLLPRYFRRGFGPREGWVRIKPEIRRRVAVSQINLFQPSYPLAGRQDVIFCRNVMIYFDTESRQQLVERLEDMLVPDGHLFVGHAESLLGLRHRLRAVRPGVYTRPG